MARLARPRPGHFDLGTGYHGDVWLDLDALFLRPSRLRPCVEWLAERLRQHSPDAVCGPLEGGAFLAYAVADDAVNAGTAVAACLRELRAQGAIPVAVAALLALGEASAMVPATLGVPFYPAGTIPSRAWPAPQCPLCADGVPVTPGADDGRSAPPAGR